MSHHIPWCGCDPNHLPTHARGKVRGCKMNEDPKESLIRDTETFFSLAPGTKNVNEAIILLRRWIDLDG